MLLMFSGGVESTSTAKWWLQNQDERLTLLHVFCPNSVNRAHLELKAVNALVPHLRRYGDFTYHQVDIHFPFDVRDSEVHTAVLPAAMRHLGERQFIKGLCLEDWKDEQGYRGPHMTPDNARARFGRRIAEYVKGYFEWDSNPLRGFSPRYESWHEVSPFFEPMLWPKARHMTYIEDLLPLTWSCLKPIDDQPCGRCGTCVLRNAHQPQATTELSTQVGA